MTSTLIRCFACKHGSHHLCRDRVCQCDHRPPSLFDEPMVRDSDPATSRAAAESVNINAREQEIVDALRFLVVASSAYEIQQALNNRGIARDKNCVSRRLTSLVRKGVVSNQGVKPGPYGRDVTAYRLVDR